MDKKLYKLLKSTNSIYKIKCTSGSHFIECPECLNKMLSKWTSKDGDMCLCYDCGAFFNLASGEIVDFMEGNPETWSEIAAKKVNEINNYKKPYGTNSAGDRRSEFFDYFFEQVARVTDVPDDLSPEEMFNLLTTCSCCDTPYFSSEEFQQALLEYDSPERTYEILNEINERHVMNEIESAEYVTVHDESDDLSDKNVPEIVLTKNIKDEIYNEVYVFYSGWVISGDIYEIDHAIDPPWDCSGETYPIYTNKAERLSMYETLGEWMNECYSGDTEPSFMSGNGLYHLTFVRNIEDIIYDYIENKFPVSVHHQNDDNYHACYVEFLLTISKSLIKFLSGVSTVQAWNFGKDSAIQRRIDLENEMEMVRLQLDEEEQIVSKIWSENFRKYNDKVDKANCKEFISKLENVLSKCDKAQLKAISSVGLPVEYSKSVQNIVDNTIKSFLDK